MRKERRVVKERRNRVGLDYDSLSLPNMICMIFIFPLCLFQHTYVLPSLFIVMYLYHFHKDHRKISYFALVSFLAKFNLIIVFFVFFFLFKLNTYILFLGNIYLSCYYVLFVGSLMTFYLFWLLCCFFCLFYFFYYLLISILIFEQHFIFVIIILVIY